MTYNQYYNSLMDETDRLKAISSHNSMVELRIDELLKLFRDDKISINDHINQEALKFTVLYI